MGTSISVERRRKIRRRIAQEKDPEEVTASLLQGLSIQVNGGVD